MIQITQMLTILGEHLPMVLVGGAEALAAIVLIGKTRIKNESTGNKKKRKENDPEQILLDTLKQRKQEVCILVRRKDMMPVYVAGDLEGMTGIPISRFQDDITILNTVLTDPFQGRRVWNDYRTWEGKECFQAELPLKNGQWIHITSQKSPMEGYELTWLETTTRIHEKIRQYENQLEISREASESKTSFLYRMSHEIRTPMNGIMGMLTLAKGKTKENDPVMQYLDKAEEVSEHLLSLINDILDMSRIEAGKVELEQKVFSLSELGQRLYDMFAKNLESRGIRYAVNYEEMTVDYVVGDELRISQIIINFLSNAVKFTKEGEVIVTFRQMMMQDGMVDLMIRVHDTGVGMQPEFINRIFRPFEQEGVDTARKYGGTGLGMAITDQLVKLMGGEIVVESAPGQGSDFSVYLHLPVASRPAIDVEEPQETEQKEMNQEEDVFHGRRILVAEDNEMNAMIATEILEEMGAEVTVAENGKVAVETFSNHPERYFDFILMDVQMPVMDGREAARTIRGLKRPDAKKIPIFALSADAFVEDERMSAESGMNGHFAKPVDFVALRHEIKHFL
jgi:signal transduction histidine kinase/CheY-like chemotaxis protein